mgnify:FL=1
MEHEKNRREYEKVTEYIYNMIASKEVMAGSRIPSERDIAANLSVSRNSVREAIRMMDSMGVLECRQGAGNFLCGNINRGFGQVLDMLFWLHETDMGDICRFRHSVEKTVYDMAYERRDNNLYITRMGEATHKFENASAAQQTALDKEFHYMLIKAAGNHFLEIFMESISDIYQGWVNAVLSDIPNDDMQALKESHSGIYKSLKDGDYDAGTAAINAHYQTIDKVIFGNDKPES